MKRIFSLLTLVAFLLMGFAALPTTAHADGKAKKGKHHSHATKKKAGSCCKSGKCCPECPTCCKNGTCNTGKCAKDCCDMSKCKPGGACCK